MASAPDTKSTRPADTTSESKRLTRRIRLLLTTFVVCLIASGLTAFPLNAELRFLSEALGIDPTLSPASYDGVRYWIATVARGLEETYSRYPFVAYGTDWLAFGHLVIAVFFVGPIRHPIRNQWVVTAGLVACVGVIPLALIAGEIRQIPLYWRALDCSFGVVGFIFLWACRRGIAALESLGRA